MFFQKFLKKKKKNPFCSCKIFNAGKKDLLYNYIYYINTYLDKTNYKSGQSFKKNQNKFSICFFRICNHRKIKKKKLVKLKKTNNIITPNEFPLWLYFWKNYVMNNWLCWIPQHKLMSEFEIHAEELNQTKYEFVKLFFDSETVFKRLTVIKIKDSAIHLV